MSLFLLVVAFLLVTEGTAPASDAIGVVFAIGGGLGLLIAALFYTSPR